MKNHLFVLVPAIFLIVTGLICSSPFGIAQISSKTSKGIQIPADMDKVFTNSCMPCHSDHGKEMAKVLLNFSKWNNYGRRAQVQKSRAICRMITKADMPPAKFIESNPELALTKVQKDNICKWVSSINPKK